MNLRFYLVMDNNVCSASEENQSLCNRLTAWTNEVIDSFSEAYNVPNGFTYKLAAIKELSPQLNVTLSPSVVFYDADKSQALGLLSKFNLTQETFKNALKFFMRLKDDLEGGPNYVTPEGDGFVPNPNYAPNTGPGINPFSGNILNDIISFFERQVPLPVWLAIAAMGAANAVDKKQGNAKRMIWGGVGSFAAFQTLKKVNKK